MNIICNNCIGSHVYYRLGERLPNPFQWCGIDLKEFVYLAKHYHELDYSGATFSLETRLYQTRESVLCTMENGKVKVHFSHYLQDSSVDGTGRNDTWKYCLLSDDIIGVGREKFYSRLGRSDEPVTFVYCFNLWDMRHPKTRKEYPYALRELFSIEAPLVIVMHESVDMPKIVVPSNVTVIKLPDEDLTFCSSALVDAVIDHFRKQ